MTANERSDTILTKLCPGTFLRDDRPAWILAGSGPPTQPQVCRYKHIATHEYVTHYIIQLNIH